MNATGLKLVLLGLLLALISCASKKETTNMKQADLYFGAGTNALMEKDYTAALTNLLKATELNPESSEIATNLAMAYYFKDERDLAVKTLHRALKLNPKNPDALMNLASIHFEGRQYAEAERLYREILKNLTYDKQARTYYNLALIEQQRRNFPGMRKHLLSAIKEDTNYCPAHYTLGMIAYQQRQFKQAYSAFRDATMGTCTDAPAPHYYQAMTLIELKRYDEAKQKLVEVSSRFKNSEFAPKAKAALMDLIETGTTTSESHVRSPRKVSDSPEF